MELTFWHNVYFVSFFFFSNMIFNNILFGFVVDTTRGILEVKKGQIDAE